MKERILTQQEIVELASRDETHFYDNKAFEVKGDKIQKIVVAFANADGGEFIIGIKDKKDEPDPLKRWQGICDIESFNFVFQNLIKIVPSIRYEAEFLKNESGTYALRITVEKSECVHKTDNDTIFIRQSAQSIPLKDPEKIQSLSFAKGESSYEDTIVNSAAAEDIYESKEIKLFLESITPRQDSVDFVVNQNLIDRRSYEPRTAGVLLFSDNPIPLLPKRCGIKITRYETSEITPERIHLKAQYSIEGCLNEQIKHASQTITDIMESVQILGPNGLEKVKYPPETIWEILVNAVIHRDYSISDDVQVLIFNNRIEVKSPGKLPGYVTVDNILDARFSRNSKIVRVLNKYKNPANKDMGEGLNTAFQRMEEFRLKQPVIYEEGNYVKVIIEHTSIATPEERIMEYLNMNSSIKNRQAREITGIKSENVMKKHFYKLRDKNIIEPVMSNNGKKVVAWKKRI